MVIQVIWEIWVICPDNESVDQGNLRNFGNLDCLRMTHEFKDCGHIGNLGNFGNLGHLPRI